MCEVGWKGLWTYQTEVIETRIGSKGTGMEIQTQTNTSTAARVSAAQMTGGISAEPIYRAILAAVVALKAEGRALDFGAGTGAMAAYLCDTGQFTRVDAVDLVDYCSERHPEVHWMFSDLNEPLPVAAETYDLIVASEVIEHLENPRMLAREWFRLLKPGGALVVSTPNNESWRSLASLAVRGHFAGFTGASYPAHITALLRKDFERILTESGYSQIGFEYTQDGGIPGRPLITWQRISFGLLRGLRYSDNIVCVARKPVGDKPVAQKPAVSQTTVK
jgi:2-polyprenyl-3-methyl-5-hydroxy-6-metoxy-1,4-benzoquinol methylase